jgi:predicted component of type VI protein secretion system
MKLSLVVMAAGKANGQSIPITLSQFLIGRDPQCQLRPASAVISKRHCAVLTKNGKVFVRDFDSTNGTFVNNDQVKGERELHHNDQLKVGPLSFRVVIETTAPVNRATPPPPKAAASSDDDSVAAMLLALQDEASGSSPSVKVDSDGVPSGSTVMDMVSPLGTDPAAPTDAKSEKEDAAKAGAKKPGEAAKKAPEPPTTSSAAKAILDKYTRRPRG